MIINFKIEKLNVLLRNFYKMTKIPLSIWDSDFNQLSYQPEDMPSFCKMIKTTTTGKLRCFHSDKELLMLCKKTGQPQTHRCHAGINDTAVPIKFQDSIFGYIIFGQIIKTDNHYNIEQTISTLAKELKLDKKILYDAYHSLSSYDSDMIEASADILSEATRFLWLSDMIEIKNNTIASEIETYIQENLTHDLSVSELCEHTNISKNKIYSISHEYFQTTIADFVLTKRLEKAKHLLLSTDMSISEISQAVGIRDHNYFSKLFKKKYGITALTYRKKTIASSHF